MYLQLVCHLKSLNYEAKAGPSLVNWMEILSVSQLAIFTICFSTQVVEQMQRSWHLTTAKKRLQNKKLYDNIWMRIKSWWFFFPPLLVQCWVVSGNAFVLSLFGFQMCDISAYSWQVSGNKMNTLRKEVIILQRITAQTGKQWLAV